MRGSGRWIAYLAAVGAGVLAVLARLALVGLFPSSAPSLTLFVAVALTSLAFGIGPGLLTVATGLAGTVLVVLPSLSGPGLVGPQLFAIIGVSALNNSLIAVLGGLQNRTRRRAEQVEALSVVTEAERVTLERELEAERARLQTLLRELPAGVVMRDRAGRLLYSNPEAERLLGTPIPTSMTGAEPIYGTMHHPDGRPFPFEDLPGPRAIRRNETVRDVELLVERADGATSLLSASAAPVHDADGQVAALISVFMISEHPFALVLPDNLFRGPNQTAAVLRAWDQYALAAALIAEISPGEAGSKGATGRARVREEPDGTLRVLDLADKARGRFDTGGHDRAATPIGRVVLPAGTWGELDDIRRSLDPGVELDDVPLLQRLARRGALVGVRCTAEFFDVGVPEGYREAVARFPAGGGP